MFSQGKRNDIMEQIKMLENPHEHRVDGTLLQVGEKSHTDRKVAEMYSLSRVNVFRYLRVNQLVSPLKAMLDSDSVPFVAAVTLSFLQESEQTQLADCIEQGKFSVDMKKADALRQLSEKGKLSADAIRRVMSGDMKPKPNRTPTVKIDKAVYAKYFKPSQSAKEVQNIVVKALELYFQRE
jgi:ParB family chromosome partitioning protein